MREALAIIGAYLVGAIPFGVLIARSRGVDLFTAGSGNIGATNVGRVLGKPYGILVFGLDFLKGALPAGLVAYWRGSVDAVAVLAGLAAVVGHMYPAYLTFRGGKGVATGAGVVTVLLPMAMLAAVLVFVSTILAGSIMSVASIAAAVALAAAQLALRPDLTAPASLLAIVVAVLVVIKHRANMTRLRAGTEPVLKSLTRFRAVTPGLHALALGLWCGAAAFFNLAATPVLFVAFNAFARDTPDWLPLNDGGPADLGNRLAGVAVTPMFPVFFAWAGFTGLLALGTAIGWRAASDRRRDSWRAGLLLAAFLFTAISYHASERVKVFRAGRLSDDPAVRAPALAGFARWHQVSLYSSMAALALCLPALALAGYPPIAVGSGERKVVSGEKRDPVPAPSEFDSLAEQISRLEVGFQALPSPPGFTGGESARRPGEAD